ncbi:MULTISPECIES: hypothetical protein [unclassified Bradyrhizobium]|uniref:hypothetical protein n=1 Tax=unclassified Bradyrhizobium TaxID=2631580 RepID=UPI002916536D|nr:MULTISPECIES: hypothetical protein [unclassified Bradyrhizobium]
MIRIVVILIALIALVYSGEWVYRSFIRPIDPMPPEIVALADHFDRNGIKVSPYAVRHGFRHSEVEAVAAFKVAELPIPFVVFVCPDKRSAAVQLDALKRDGVTRAGQNGRMVLELGLWADDDQDRALKIIELFNAFDGSQGS